MTSPCCSDPALLLPLRRSHPRYPVQKIASYDHKGKRFLTLTVDLALGGMRIRAHQYLSEGERLNFKVVLGENPIWLEGKIVYSRLLRDEGCVSGVEFVDISERDRNSLENYLGTLKEWLKQGHTLSANTVRHALVDSP